MNQVARLKDFPYRKSNRLGYQWMIQRYWLVLLPLLFTFGRHFNTPNAQAQPPPPEWPKATEGTKPRSGLAVGCSVLLDDRNG